MQWDLHSRKPKKIFDVPGAPLEIRCAWGANHDYCFTASALTSKIWLIYADEHDEWQASDVADIGQPAEVPLPVNISISSDDKTLWATTFMDGKARLFDISEPHRPQQVFEQKIGSQVNIVSSSWDGKRLYFTSSLLANWDKKGPDNQQFFKAFSWNGRQLTERFAIDFTEEKLGRAHQMRFGAYALYGKKPK